MIVDLRSDTVTKPDPGMLEAMMQAETGDDVFGEDPTINLLEATMAKLFGCEAGLFCASGTMANQIALKAQTSPMDEIIAHELCHIYYYETGGYAFNSGVSIKLAKGQGGIMTAEEVIKNIQPDFDWLPKTSLVTLENTCNKGGGTCYDLETMVSISKVCKEHKLNRHLDGARIFNAIQANGYSPQQIGPLFDTISVCFSKGLGAPVGSILLGERATIRKARRIRKVFGGGMRQAGILAAACLYALENNVAKLENDHEHASAIASVLSEQPWVKQVHPTDTNIVIFDVESPDKLNRVIAGLADDGIRVIQFGPATIRCVTHLDISLFDVNYVEEKIRALKV
ncbi:MAG: aminotransferase class I/II-fold pyridoxal phosphate-dependent enzyme [Bacteroidetes bacterium]|nr:aminotransferase class I/II-fold pyridoxal phosphate-dependent enzyme [Bacteroidota bacterium]